MSLPRNFLLRAGPLLLALLAPGCAKETDRGEPAAVAELPVTREEVERPSPSAALVDAFNAICAEPVSRRPVEREAARRGFAPVPLAVLREEAPRAVFPPDAAAWRGPGEVGGAVALLWDAATGTCEVRAQGVDPLAAEAEFAKLPQALEGAGSLVMRLNPPPAEAGGAPRTRHMLLVSPGGAPERARVLRFGDGGAEGRDTVVLTARGVAGAR